MNIRARILTILIATSTALAGLSSPAFAQSKAAFAARANANIPSQGKQSKSQVAGRVIVVVGRVMATGTDGTQRRLQRRSLIYSGDTIVTSATGYAQMRYRDGGLMSLRQSTEFQIENYRYNGREDGTERSFFKLAKGGFRTISGLIGKKHREAYRVNTPVATIGIRGTLYGARLCGPGQCFPGGAEAENADPNNAVPPGLYMGVRAGATSLTNDTGTSVHPAGSNNFVGGQNQPPQESLAPFGFVFDNFEADAEEEENDQGQQQDQNDQQQNDGDDQNDQGRNQDGQDQGDNQDGQGQQDQADNQDGQNQQGQTDNQGGQDQQGQTDNQGGQDQQGQPGQDNGQGTPDGQSPPDGQGDQAQGADGQTGQGTGQTGGAQSTQTQNTGPANQGTPESPAGPAGAAPTASPSNNAPSSNSAPNALGGLPSLPALSPSLNVGPATTTALNLNVNPVTTIVTPTVQLTNQISDTSTVSDTKELIGATGLIALFPTSGSGVAGGGTSDGSALTWVIGKEKLELRQALANNLNGGGGEFQSASGGLDQLNQTNGIIISGSWTGAWQAKGSNDASFSTGIGHSHFIYSPNNGTQKPGGTGRALFRLGNGGTNPTHTKLSNGSTTIGQTQFAALSVDLGTETVKDFRLDISAGSANWNSIMDPNASSVSFADATTKGIELTGNCSGCSGSSNFSASGLAALSFVVNGATTQAITSFWLQTNNRQYGVNGTAVLDKLEATQVSNDNVAILAYADLTNSGYVPSTHVAGNGDTTSPIQTTTYDGVGNVVIDVEDTNSNQVWSANVAHLAEHGGDTAGLNWGRWDHDWRSSQSSGQINDAPAYFAYTDKATNATTISALTNFATPSVANFNLHGAPSPGDNLGNLGSLTHGNFDLAFGGGSLDIQNYQVTAVIDGRTYSGVQQNTTVNYATASSQGIELTVNNTPSSSSVNGNANVVLVGNPSNDVPGDAISGFTMSDGGRIASGVMHLKKQ